MTAGQRSQPDGSRRPPPGEVEPTSAGAASSRQRHQAEEVRRPPAGGDEATRGAPARAGAPTWVLLRGLTRDARHWGGFVACFEAALPGAKVVAVDLPGNGVLNGERSPTTVAGLLAPVRAQLLDAGLQPPYAVFAMSLGAMVALEWAATRPRELDAAVLVNSSLAGVSPCYRRLRPSALALFAGLHARGADGDAWERAILHLTTQHPPDPSPLLHSWQAWRRERPVRNGNALRQLAAAARFRLAAATLAVPLLVLAGRRDRLVDPHCSRALASRFGATLVEHPTAGHDLPADAPHWVAAQVARWRAGARADG